MKKIGFVMFVLMLAVVLSGCSSAADFPAFNGSRTGNDHQFIMTYTAFNRSDSQKLKAQAGDTIHAEIVVESGRLSYGIQKEDGKMIAAANSISASETLDVKAAEAGTYIVTVTGEKAKGSVKFIVERAE